MKKRLLNVFSLLIIIVSLSSCLVVNNLYVNDPFPVVKGSPKGYVGLSTGLKPRIDSISDGSNAIHFSNHFSTSYALSLGGQFRLGNKINLRLAGHLPQILGGFGLRAGLQYSVLNNESPLNIAIGSDLGFAISRDSIKIFGQYVPTQSSTEGGINADFFIPIGYRFNSDVSLVVTPRYSFNSMEIKKYSDKFQSDTYKQALPILSLGLKIRGFYIESTNIFYNNKIYPQLGFAYIFSPSN